MKKLKVLRIINRFNLGGPTYNATLLTRYMSDDFETLLIGGVHDEGEADSLHILKENNVNAIVIPELKRDPNFFSDRKAYFKIKQIIKEFQPDIVHTHASKAGLIGRYAAYKCGVKSIIHTYHGHVFHSYFGKIKTHLIIMVERFLANKSTGIVAISESQKEELAFKYKICNSDKIKVIHLGFDLSKFLTNSTKYRKEVRDQFRIKEDEVAIAIIGRLAPIKNHVFFLNIIEELLKKELKKIKVFIVGNGSEYSRIHEKVKQINLKYGEIISLTSWILDISKFNCGMDIICLTSDNEGTPVSLIEGQASGLPVISTKIGGVSDIVKENESGFLIEKEDLETYAEKLRLLVVDKSLREKFGSRGREMTRNNFHYSNLIIEMQHYYLSLSKY